LERTKTLDILLNNTPSYLIHYHWTTDNPIRIVITFHKSETNLV